MMKILILSRQVLFCVINVDITSTVEVGNYPVITTYIEFPYAVVASIVPETIDFAENSATKYYYWNFRCDVDRGGNHS